MKRFVDAPGKLLGTTADLQARKQTAEPIIFTKNMSDLTNDLSFKHAEKCGVKIGQFTSVEQKEDVEIGKNGMSAE